MGVFLKQLLCHFSECLFVHFRPFSGSSILYEGLADKKHEPAFGAAAAAAEEVDRTEWTY